MNYKLIINAPYTTAIYQIEAATDQDALQQARVTAAAHVMPARIDLSLPAWEESGLAIVADSADSPAWWAGGGALFERFPEAI